MANWLIKPDHLLTAWVLVNRLWQGHIGAGLVSTPSDFGTLGDKRATPNCSTGWPPSSSSTAGASSTSTGCRHLGGLPAGRPPAGRVARPGEPLLDGPGPLARAAAFAKRVMPADGKDVLKGVDAAYRLAFGRPPTTAEAAEAQEFLR